MLFKQLITKVLYFGLIYSWEKTIIILINKEFLKAYK